MERSRSEDGDDGREGVAAKRARQEDDASASAATSGEPWDYRGKVVLAPMVRVGTLPTRLLARGYGADMVYSEELIDHKLIRCERFVDELAPPAEEDDAVIPADWVRPRQVVRFAMKEKEKGALHGKATMPPRNVFITYADEPVCLQLGTGGAVTALQAAQVVCRDVKAIDINMGCPLNFSIKGGMGSSLLAKPETVHDIVSTLKRNLPSHVAVTCKIRLLEDEAELLELGRRIEAAGADAVAVHARFVPDRSNSCAARWALARPLCDSLSIPCLANGDVFLPEDAAKVYAATGCDGIMVGRGAMWNPSIFKGAAMHLRHAQAQAAAGDAAAAALPAPAGADDVVPLYDVARAYIGLTSWTGNFFQNTKYCLLEMLKGHSRITTSPYYQQYFIRANGACVLPAS
jgi:tRNA-dihydrouridine synthase 2